MPMRRDERGRAGPSASSLQASLDPCELQSLHTLLRRAVSVALASSLMAAGCHTDSGARAESVGQGAGADADGSSEAGAAASVDDAGAGRSGAAGIVGMTGMTGMTGADNDLDAGLAQPDAGHTKTWDQVVAACARDRRPLSGLQPAPSVDYIALRTLFAGETIFNPGEAPSEARFETIASEGSACKTALTPATCTTALENAGLDLARSDLCGQVYCRNYFVTTQADSVRTYASRPELLALLGSIDTPQEALLLLQYAGYQSTCAAELVRDGVYEAVVTKMLSDCPVQHALVTVQVTAAGTVTEVRSEAQAPGEVCIGRRPEGFVTTAWSRQHDLGQHFAAVATLEAASVAAFEIIAAELVHYGAPVQLVEAARCAASDEVRHAERMAALALRFGVQPVAPDIAPRALRSLAAFALDNAVEGCVRETYGAAVGCYQSERATDPDVAAVMRDIAQDELRHATLSHALHAWVWPQLAAAERADVSRARAEAVEALARNVQCEPAIALQRGAGLPNAAAATALHTALVNELWS